MGKKTKKEKILAEYHRKLQTLNGSQFTVHSSQYSLSEKKEQPTAKVVNYTVPSVNPVYRELVSDYSYVLSDLKKIALLTALAICAQLVLWYRLR